MTDKLTTFVEGAKDSIFSIYNLPYGVFNTENYSRIGTAIGSYVLDLALLEQEGLITTSSLFNQSTLNLFAAQGQQVWSTVRKRIQSLLSSSNHELQDKPDLLAKALIPIDKVRMMAPFKIEGFTDFYAGEHHATNVGKLFRSTESPLLPNWKYLPVAYNGRASTVFPSGTSIARPKGQIKPSPEAPPIFALSKKLDYELELGIFVGTGNPDGKPITLKEAHSHIFGCVLLNDWSARDIQAFEYQPLGPFLGKSFGTSISNWVVPLEALQPFMKNLPKQVPQPVDYLFQEHPQQFDIKLTVEIQPAGSTVRTKICETNSMELYWSMEQMLAHHTVNNCVMRTGDLLGTGTISGPEKQNWGSLLEITFNGNEPITLNDGSVRRFLEDGDTIFFTGYCDAGDYKIGFGTLEGKIIA